MSVRLVYLDSSSIVKRYIGEKGSEVVDSLYAKAETGRLRICFSVWNVGEVLGVFDKYASRGIISKEMLSTALLHFIEESMKMVKLESLQILPLTTDAFVDSWLLVMKHHIYEADALQMSTSKRAECSLLLSADSNLVQIAGEEGFEAVNIESDPDRALAWLEAA